MSTADLTSLELAVLKRHGIALSEVYDARDVPSSKVKELMAERGALVVVGQRKCDYGHQLHTRAGKCAVCNPSAITFQRQHSREQYVYAAHSDRHGLGKIGVTSDVLPRIHELNRKCHAGASDWQAIFSASCARAGDVEQLALRLLRGWKGVRRGQDVPGCYEVVRCDVGYGEAAVREALHRLGMDDTKGG
jgi:hypothetical protein